MISTPAADPPAALVERLSEDEAAGELNIAPKTLRNYRKRGIGPRYAIVARRIEYTRPWLNEWIAAGGTRAA